MELFLSELKHEQKIFIGDYDSYTIISKKINANDLLFKTKIALLLFDRVLMPAAFFWQSQEMNYLMARLEEPISNGFVLPVIRDFCKTNDICEYFDMRACESEKIGMLGVFKQPDLASEIADKKKNKKSVDRLISMNSYAHSDISSVKSVFVSSWKADLMNHDDINSIRMLLFQSQLPKTKIQALLAFFSDVAEYPQFTRAYCIEQVQKYIPSGKIQDLIKDRVSYLYLKSNALSYDSKFYYSYDPYNKMIFEENLMLLSETLGAMGIKKELINELSIGEILRIKSSEEYRSFISKYRKLIKDCYCQQNNIIDTLKKKITWELRKEKTISTFCKKLYFIQGTSFCIFIGLLINYFSKSEINAPVFVSTGVMGTVPSILKRFDSLNRIIEKPFSNFEKIITEKYKSNYEDHI